jgi:hypothetical protein
VTAGSDKVPTDLPPTIGRPATGALLAEGYTSLEQLTVLSKRQLLAIHGVGPKAVRIIEAELAARGLRLAPPE